MKEAISILKSEHRSISAILYALKELARMAHDATVRPRFQVLRSMLRYIDEYPEKLHHPKENEHLFARLVARALETSGMDDRILDWAFRLSERIAVPGTRP